MVKGWHYIYSGLRVSSELFLPEWEVFRKAHPFAQPDVVIRVGRDAPKSDETVLTADEYSFHMPEAGYYSVRGGRDIVVTPATDAGMGEVRLFLLGSAWGALCYQRGMLALHTSVVQIDGRAVAFCGAAGSGKTSVAAWLGKGGHPLVSDDLCQCDVPPAGPPLVYPSAPRFKLWRDTLEALGWSEAGLARDHFRLDKFHLPISRDDTLPPLPLRAIYLLGWGKPAVRPLTGLEALRRFVESATYRGDLLDPMGIVADHWERCARLIQRVPVWEWVRPCDWGAMEESLQLLTSNMGGESKFRRRPCA